MVALNFFLPIFSFLFVFTNNDKSFFLNTCLDKGYLSFFSTESNFCSYDNPYQFSMCWVWLSILSIGNSKFQINTSVRIKVQLIKMRSNIFILGLKSNENKAIGLLKMQSETLYLSKQQKMFIWYSIAMSNIIDAYCVYRCSQEIKIHTEETKEMTSKKAYINRKRYNLLY